MTAIILVEPQMGENIGAAARAMANFSFTDLRLVSPRDGWPSEQAVAMSAGALPDIVSVEVFETLEDAIADTQYVLATTARRRDMNKPVFTSSEAAKEFKQKSDSNIKTAILFGRERNGLENDEVAMANGIVHIPTNPDFSSLNLGQSVLLLAYEIFQQGSHETVIEKYEASPFAEKKQISDFLNRLEEQLEEGRFFRSEDVRPHVWRNISNIFTRNDLTEQEIKTLHGVLTAIRNKN